MPRSIDERYKAVPRSRTSSAALLAVATSVALIGATACGAGSSSEGGGGFSGVPVKIGVIQEETGPLAGPNLTQWGDASKAAAEYINAELGGFGGRQVQIVECDSQSTTAGALSCANKMVAEKVDLVTGVSLNFGANGVQILEKAKIPMQTLAISVQEFSSPLSFPISGGSATQFPGQFQYARSLGVQRGAFTAAESSAAKLVVDRLGALYSQAGGTLVPALIPASSADIAPTVAKLISSDLGIVHSSLSGVKAVKLYEGLHDQGWDPKRILSAGSVADVPNFFSKFTDPAVLEGTLYSYEAVSFDELSDPEVATYRAAMKKYAGVDGRAEYAQFGFAVVMSNYELAKTIGFDKFNSTTMASAWTNDTVPIFMGYQYQRSVAPADTPAIGNPYLKITHWENSQLSDEVPGWIHAITGQVVPDRVPAAAGAQPAGK